MFILLLDLFLFPLRSNDYFAFVLVTLFPISGSHFQLVTVYYRFISVGYHLPPVLFHSTTICNYFAPFSRF